MRPIDIRGDHLQIVQKILRTHLPRGVKVWVFGSRAQKATHKYSDLDLALESNSQLTDRDIGALKDAFEASDLPYMVDVIDLSNVNESFREIVEKRKVPFPA